MNRARPVPGMPYTMELAVPEWLEKQMKQREPDGMPVKVAGRQPAQSVLDPVGPTAPRDYLAEAGRILRGETMMLTTKEHLEAVAFLIGWHRPPRCSKCREYITEEGDTMKQTTDAHTEQFKAAREEMIEAVLKGQTVGERLSIMFGIFQKQAAAVNDGSKAGAIDHDDIAHIHTQLFKHANELRELVMSGRRP